MREAREEDKYHGIAHVESEEADLLDLRVEWQLPGRWEKWGDVGQRVQTCDW